MISRANDQDMCNGPLLKKLVIFALPILAMNILHLLFNTVDMVVAGQFVSGIALAAVGATASLINLIVNFFMGLSVGTSVIVAQDYGANKLDDVSRSVHTSIFVSIISGLFVMLIGVVFCEPLLIMMGTPNDIINLSVLYMKIYFLGVPATMVYNFCASILRAVGDSRRPMYYLVVSGLLNVVLDLIFVIVLHMGVDGLAWATVLSQYVSLILILINLTNADDIIRFSFKKMRMDKIKLKQILRIGLPAGLQSLLFSISNVLIQSAVNAYGSIMVAASSAASSIEGFVGTTMNAYYNAAITFTGQNTGAKKFDRIDTIAKICTVLIFLTWIVMGGLTMLFARPLLRIYTSDPQVIDLGVVRINIMMIAYFTAGVMNVYPGLSRGMGFSILPMLCTLVGACVMRIVWLWTFYAWNPSITMLFVCYPITWALAGIGQVATFFYARHKVRADDLREVKPAKADTPQID